MIEDRKNVEWNGANVRISLGSDISMIKRNYYSKFSLKKLFPKKEKGNFYSIYQSIEFFFFFTSNYIDTRTAKIIREIHTRLSENSFFYVIQFKILSKIHS